MSGRDPLDEMILLQAVSNEIADGPDLQSMHAREFHEVVEPRHRTIFAHDLADDAAWIEPGEARHVHCGLRVTGAYKDATRLGDKRKDMAGRDDRFTSMRRVYGNRDRASPVCSTNARRNPILRLNRHGKSRLVAASVCSSHRLKTELVGTLFRQCEADETTAVPCHEIHSLGRRHLSRDHEVTFIFTALIIHEDEHAPIARLIDDRLRADQYLRRAALDQFLEPSERVRSRIPVEIGRASC